jgi:GTP-binding protein
MNDRKHSLPGADLPLVAIIGRPNVGKSTLFNRLVGRRQAIVDNRPGVTRDRHYAVAEWVGTSFALVDTGGFDLFDEENMALRIREQAEEALREADLVLFVVDALEGPTLLDEELGKILRSRFGGPVLFLANKVDNPRREAAAFDFYRFGVEKVFPVSAEHGTGLDDALDEVVRLLPCSLTEEQAPETLHVALVGRPNVGKSSLVNAILGKDRVIVDSTPGTTRDAVDTAFSRDGKPWVLIDTAGIRRRGKIGRSVEKYSVLRSVRGIDRADVCVLVLDAEEMVTSQDAHVGGAIVDARRACVVVVNKWDLVTSDSQAGDDYRRKVREGMKHLTWAPVVFTSALTGRGVEKMLTAIEKASVQFRREITTPDLNQFFRKAVQQYKPPTLRGKTISMGYITQEKTMPPTFAVLVNESDRVHFSYRRYLENRMREEYGFEGTSLVLRFKSKEGRRSRGRQDPGE